MTTATFAMDHTGRRYISAILPATVVTAGLFSLMIGLIAEDFQPQDVVPIGDLAIHPDPIDIDIVEPRIKMIVLEKIETPPAPPPVEIAVTEKPAEPLHSLTGSKPSFGGPIIEPSIFVVSVVDRDPEPIVRIPPNMPARADRSGHCQMRFSVSPGGRPYDVTAMSCSQELFARASVRAVQSWTYRPKIADGRPVERTGLQTRISFRLTDDRGVDIPE